MVIIKSVDLFCVSLMCDRRQSDRNGMPMKLEDGGHLEEAESILLTFLLLHHGLLMMNDKSPRRWDIFRWGGR